MDDVNNALDIAFPTLASAKQVRAYRSYTMHSVPMRVLCLPGLRTVHYHYESVCFWNVPLSPAAADLHLRCLDITVRIVHS